MKTILVPTDFSNNAYCALFYAAKLYENTPVRFVILNSFENQLSFIDSLSKTSEGFNKLYKSSEAKGITLKHKLINDLENTTHTFKIIATPLKLTKAINDLIIKENIDLVVMGRRGEADKKSIFLGSNCFKVIKSIKKTPLLIIPDEIEYTPPCNIGFVTGLKYRYYKSQLKPILDFSKRFKSKVKLIFISEQKKLSKQEQGNFNHVLKISKDNKFEFSKLAKSISKYDTLMNYVFEEQIDLLTLSYYKHHFISDFLRESVVENMSKHITIPLLILASLD